MTIGFNENRAKIRQNVVKTEIFVVRYYDVTIHKYPLKTPSMTYSKYIRIRVILSLYFKERNRRVVHSVLYILVLTRPYVTS